MLLVNEAQHLPMRLLDEIRSLTNLMRDMQPAVRMVLAGSHVLEERFASPKLESFSQRISARCYLEAFQRAETAGIYPDPHFGLRRPGRRGLSGRNLPDGT